MPEKNWWTEPLFAELTGMERERLTPLQRCRRRVDYYLGDYDAHFASHYYADNVSADGREPTGGGTGGEATQPGFEEEIAIKADLDRAIRLLPPRQRRAVELCRVGVERVWFCCYDLGPECSRVISPGEDLHSPPLCPECHRPFLVKTAALLERQAADLMRVSRPAVSQLLARGLDGIAETLAEGVTR